MASTKLLCILTVNKWIDKLQSLPGYVYLFTNQPDTLIQMAETEDILDATGIDNLICPLSDGLHEIFGLTPDGFVGTSLTDFSNRIVQSQELKVVDLMSLFSKLNKYSTPIEINYSLLNLQTNG